jgi:hypothetical protein
MNIDDQTKTPLVNETEKQLLMYLVMSALPVLGAIASAALSLFYTNSHVTYIGGITLFWRIPSGIVWMAVYFYNARLLHDYWYGESHASMRSALKKDAAAVLKFAGFKH